MKSRGCRKRRKVAGLYTKGELNKLVDSLCHPLFKVDKGFMILDGFLHALIKQNPPLSIRKFIRHNLSKLIEGARERKN